MANLSLAALQQMRSFLIAPDGLNQRLRALAARDMVHEPEIREDQVIVRQIGPDLADAASKSVYPAVYLWCSRLENRLEVKFTAFSGRATLVAEARVSQETVAELDGSAERFAEAVTDTLAEHHGSWTAELAFDGRYEVKFGAVERGGVGYLQAARIEVELLANA